MLVLLCVKAEQVAATQYWQLTLEYDSQRCDLHDASPVSPLLKEVRTPGLDGAPGILNCSIDWFDSKGGLLEARHVDVPVGRRSVLNGEGPCTTSLPAEGVIVVRLEGPATDKRPYSIRIRPLSAKGLGQLALQTHQAFRNLAEFHLPIKQNPQQGTLVKGAGPRGVSKIRDTGSDSNRLVFVVVGDGYTSPELSLGGYEEDASALLDGFLIKGPWTTYFDVTNVYRIDVESNESGADEEREEGEPPVQRDTYFNSAFWTAGIEYDLSIDQEGELRAIQTADEFVGVGVWDRILMLVNSTKYGGSGGNIPIASIHPDSSEIMVHELGHSFAGLADEYSYPFPGYPPGDSEPNVDFDFDGPGLKWSVWVEAGTPLPTPDSISYNNVVGAFEGARYLTTGIYRPWRNCLMKTLGRPFCPVCREAHVLAITDLLNLADGISPPVGGTYDIPPIGREFSVAPLPISGWNYEWSLGGERLNGEIAAQISLSPDTLGTTPQNLLLKLTHETPLVRRQSIQQVFEWFVQAEATPFLTPTPTDTHQPQPSATPTATHTPTPTFTSTFDFDIVDDDQIDAHDLIALLQQSIIPPHSGGQYDLWRFSLHWMQVHGN